MNQLLILVKLCDMHCIHLCCRALSIITTPMRITQTEPIVTTIDANPQNSQDVLLPLELVVVEVDVEVVVVVVVVVVHGHVV